MFHASAQPVQFERLRTSEKSKPRIAFLYSSQVSADLARTWPKILSGGVLCSDDWTMSTVQAATKFFAT